MASVAFLAPTSPPDTGASNAFISYFLASVYISCANLGTRCRHIYNRAIRF